MVSPTDFKTAVAAGFHQVNTARDFLIGEPIPPKIRRIQDEVCQKHGITRLDLLSSRKHRALYLARQEGYWRARNETPASLPQIAAAFRRADHTTIMHGINCYKKRIGELNGQA